MATGVSLRRAAGEESCTTRGPRMGIVVDFSQSTIDVEHDPDVLNKLKPFYQVIDKPRVVFPLMKFEAKFAFDFDPDKGTYPPANKTGSFKIGIVQNVLSSRLLVKYADGKKMDFKNSKAAIDCGDMDAFPFYNVPGGVSLMTSTGPDTKIIFPYRSFSYDANGVSEDGGDGTRTWSEVSHLDQPSVKVKLRSHSDAVISELMHIVVFGIWLVVLPSDSTIQPLVLAHSDVLSLMCSAKFSTRDKKLLSIGIPDSEAKTRALNGRAQSPDQFTSMKGLRISPGSGKTHPLIKGTTAQEADKSWEKTLLSL